jgi:hypothetical protein
VLARFTAELEVLEAVAAPENPPISAPGYWRNETSGALRPAIKAYLQGGLMTESQITPMRHTCGSGLTQACGTKIRTPGPRSAPGSLKCVPWSTG